jgi:hypothetical protein
MDFSKGKPNYKGFYIHRYVTDYKNDKPIYNYSVSFNQQAIGNRTSLQKAKELCNSYK